MWKFIPYTKSNLQKLDHSLSALEAKGFRVVQVFCNYWFHLKATMPKDGVHYFSTAYFIKDYDISLQEIELFLKQKYGANPIETKLSRIYLLRIVAPVSTADWDACMKCRKAYHLRVVKQELALDAVILLLSSVGFFFAPNQGLSCDSFLIWLCAILLVLLMVIL